jgi:hypothetical protein
MTMLTVSDLNQYYGGSHILRNVSFEAPSGKVTALLGDPEGLDRIRDARSEAEREGFVGLVFEARLAVVEVSILTAVEPAAADAAAAEQRALVKDARARGYARVAQLAETVSQR